MTCLEELNSLFQLQIGLYQEPYENHNNIDIILLYCSTTFIK